MLYAALDLNGLHCCPDHIEVPAILWSKRFAAGLGRPDNLLLLLGQVTNEGVTWVNASMTWIDLECQVFGELRRAAPLLRATNPLGDLARERCSTIELPARQEM